MRGISVPSYELAAPGVWDNVAQVPCCVTAKPLIINKKSPLCAALYLAFLPTVGTGFRDVTKSFNPSPLFDPRRRRKGSNRHYPPFVPMAPHGLGVAGRVNAPSQGPGFSRPSSGLENLGGRGIDATEHPGTLPPSVMKLLGAFGLRLIQKILLT